MPHVAQLLNFGTRQLLVTVQRNTFKMEMSWLHWISGFALPSFRGQASVGGIVVSTAAFQRPAYHPEVANVLRCPHQNTSLLRNSTPQWWYTPQKVVGWLYWRVLVQCWTILKSYILNQHKHCKWHTLESSWHLTKASSNMSNCKLINRI